MIYILQHSDGGTLCFLALPQVVIPEPTQKRLEAEGWSISTHVACTLKTQKDTDQFLASLLMGTSSDSGKET